MSGSVDYVEDTVTLLIQTVLKVIGATFVVKTLNTEIFAGKPRAGQTPDQADDWVPWANDLGLEGPGGDGPNSGSASAVIKTNPTDPGKPVWVVSGWRADPGGSFVSGGIILYSENGGATWESVFERFEVFPGVDNMPLQFGPTGIVWDADERAFYASFFIRIYYSSGGGVDGDEPMTAPGEEIYKSTDGRSWTLVSQRIVDDLGDPATAISDLNAHCNKPENQNRAGGDQKIPDGLQGYNVTTGTFARPTSLLGFNPQDGARYDDTIAASVTVVGEHHGGTATVSAPCYAVGYFNNVWVAVGGGEPVDLDHLGGTFIDVSFDDGRTWTNVFQSPTATYHGATVSGQRSA